MAKQLHEGRYFDSRSDVIADKSIHLTTPSEWVISHINGQGSTRIAPKMSLPTRKIGNTSVTAIGYGAMGLSTMYGKPLPEEEALKVA